MPPALVTRSLAIFAIVVLALTAAGQLHAGSQVAFGEGEESQLDRKNVAGEFDYYALVLSWSPTHCASLEGDDDELQCRSRDGRRYAFVLHGLWPQYARGYPESCRLRRKPYVPEELIQSMLDVMPSRGLIIHEYRKHGSCSGLNPFAYYALSRRLYETITIPEPYRNPFETVFVSPEVLKQEFARANPGLTPEMIAVSCTGRDNRLHAIRVCFSKSGEPIACGENEAQRPLCSAREITLPPVRSRKDPHAGKPAGSLGSPLPGPR